MNMTNKAGFPRPVLPLNGKNTPMPWVADDGPAEGQWARVNTDRAILAEVQDLCIICGEALTPDWVFCLVSGRGFSHRSPLIALGVGAPSSTRTHPKCALIGALYCPHLRDQEFPAESQDGVKLTVEELKRLSRAATN